LAAGVAGSRMAVSAVVSWAASRSAAVVVVVVGGVVVGAVGAAGTVLVVAVRSGWWGVGRGLLGGRRCRRPPAGQRSGGR
jgi:hypothetical protein